MEKERTKGCSEDILNCVVNRMFTGQWQSEVICTQCSNSNLQIEKFNTLPLEFPNKYYKNTGSQVLLTRFRLTHGKKDQLVVLRWLRFALLVSLRSAIAKFNGTTNWSFNPLGLTLPRKIAKKLLTLIFLKMALKRNVKNFILTPTHRSSTSL